MDEKKYWAMEPEGNGFRALLEQDLGLSDEAMMSLKYISILTGGMTKLYFSNTLIVA